MNRTMRLQERRMEKFCDVLGRYEAKRLSALDAAELLGMSERGFRHYRRRYEEEGLDGLFDRRLGKASARRVSVDRIEWMLEQYRTRHVGWVVNYKKIKRLMREHALQPPRRRRFVATTDSDHDDPVFPDRSRDREVDGPNQLWVADLTYIAILGGFVYLAAIMDAWSRRIVGYALGRRIDARLTLAALTTAIEHRNPPAGCVHHSDRGSQYAAQAYRALLDEHGLVGSMGRRGNPYDNAMMESFMKTLKVEGVYPMAFESADDVAEHLPRFIDS